MSKSSKHRPCPAVQREISSAECGENRVSRFACPASCEFNPFAPANYDSCLEIEGRLSRKSAEWYLSTVPDRGAALRKLEKLMGDGLVEATSARFREWMFHRDGGGPTMMERWQAAGFPGLKNDERVAQLAAMQSRLRLIEVHRVLDDIRIEAVDLFEADPQPFLVFDRGLAAMACRFTVLVSWFYPLPFYWRFAGFAVEIDPAAGFDPVDWVDHLVRHLGCPPWSGGRVEWFSENFDRFRRALNAVALARRELMLASLDADFGKAVYELRAPFAECRSVMDAHAQVVPDRLADGESDEGFADARAWMETGGSGEEVRGRILLGQSHWRAEAVGAARLARLRESLEQTLGPRLKFSGERRDDLSAHLRSKAPAYDKDLVPPALLDSPAGVSLRTSRISVPVDGPAALSTVFEDQNRAWVNTQVPALNNRTPREAAADPELRPVLLLLLKRRVRTCDEQELRTGSRTDVNWLLRELGANELIFDPPSPRPPLDGEDLDEDLDDEADSGGEFADDLLPWPLLPDRPFNTNEILERVGRGVANHPSIESALGAMESAGCFWYEDLPEVLDARLSLEDLDFLTPLLAEIWFALVPPGYFGPVLPLVDFRTEFDRLLGLLRAYEAGHSAAEAATFITTGSTQPALMAMMADQFRQLLRDAAHDELPGPEAQLIQLLLLRVAIDQLDRHCRMDMHDEE